MAKLKFILTARRIIDAAGLTVSNTVDNTKHVRIFCRHPASGHRGFIDVPRTGAPCSRAEANIRSCARSIARGTYSHMPARG